MLARNLPIASADDLRALVATDLLAAGFTPTLVADALGYTKDQLAMVASYRYGEAVLDQAIQDARTAVVKAEEANALQVVKAIVDNPDLAQTTLGLNAARTLLQHTEAMAKALPQQKAAPETEGGELELDLGDPSVVLGILAEVPTRFLREALRLQELAPAPQEALPEEG